MSVWRNEEDFSREINMLSEFYISDITPMAQDLNITKQTSGENKFLSKPWYESDSDDEIVPDVHERNLVEPEEITSGESPSSNLKLMKNIRHQVQTAIGNRYDNDILEKLYKVQQNEPSTSEKVAHIKDPVEEASEKSPKNINGKKLNIAETIENSSSKLSNPSNNWKKPPGSPKTYHPNQTYRNSNRYNNYRGHNRGSFSHRNKMSSRSSDDYNIKSDLEFPPL